MKERNNRIRKIVWGIFLMGAAGLVIANAYYGFVEFFPLICAVVIAPVIIESLVHLNFVGVFVPAALLGIAFSKQLGIESITPWPILAASVLLTVGFSIIFHKRNSKWFMSGLHLEDGETFEDVLDDEMTCTVKFGASTKYIISENFEKAYLDCSFGSIKAYFDNAKLSPNGAKLHINSSFSGVELYIPRNWKIVEGISAFMGGVEEKSKNIPDPDSPTLSITGNISLSGVVIYYI